LWYTNLHLLKLPRDDNLSNGHDENELDGIMTSDSAAKKKPSEKDVGARAALPEQVANRLRDMIVENQLPPGERIRERKISAELNVSRTPLREALKVLAAEGLVELLPNRGAVVAAPGAEDVREMLEVQGVLEEHAGHLFGANATDADISEIHALHFEMLAAFERRERLTYFKLNQRIHRKIIEVAGNGALNGVHEMLSARLFRFRYQPNLNVELWQSAIEEHEEILKAVVERDGPNLGRILRAHLKTTWEKLSKVMAEEEG